MISTNEKEVFFYGSSLVATVFEYVLIFASVIPREGDGGSNAIIIVAVLSIFVFSLSGEVCLFSENRLSRSNGMPPLIRWLGMASSITTGIALIVTFSVLVFFGYASDAVAGAWHGLLAPRVFLQSAAFIHLLRRIDEGQAPRVEDCITPMLKRLGRR